MEGHRLAKRFQSVGLNMKGEHYKVDCRELRLCCTMVLVEVVLLWVPGDEMVVVEMTLGLDMGVKMASWVEHNLEPCSVDTGKMVGSNFLVLQGVLQETELEVSHLGVGTLDWHN
jgi:hypothetical protein